MSGITYFVQSVSGGPIKIGFTTLAPAVRLAALQTGHPERLRVITYLVGPRFLETKLHTQFAAWRLMGEWFDEAAPGLWELIVEIDHERQDEWMAAYEREHGAIGATMESVKAVLRAAAEHDRIRGYVPHVNEQGYYERLAHQRFRLKYEAAKEAA